MTTNHSSKSKPLTENEVCELVSLFLISNGFDRPTKREKIWIPAGVRGFDVDASNDKGERWLIEGKGATSSRESSAKFSLEYGSGEAFSAVAQAFLTAVAWTQRDDLKGCRIGLALPSNKWFDHHSGHIEKPSEMLGITIFRVKRDHDPTVFGKAF